MSSNVEKALTKFAKDVVRQSRSRLTKQKKNATKSLYDSIGYELDVSKKGTSFSLSFKMEDYGEFIDRGVDGVDVKRGSKGYNGESLSYKKKAPPPAVFSEWAKVRGIKPRDKKTGKFITNKAFGFIMSRHIFKQGQEPTMFFTKSVDQQLENLINNIDKDFGLDLDNLLDFTTE